ncbi:MAG TPA: CoA transferase [Acetobacteraceae bacterium]|nr:CoA transferase [Acetobacteraceae bacterium]
MTREVRVIQELIQELIACAGVEARSDVVTVGKGKLLLGTPLRATELAAAALGAQAALICEVWRIRTGRQQKATLDMEGAALALQSVLYQRQWKYGIALTEPSYPTIGMYPTKDKRSVMINGGYPDLRDRLLDLLQCPDNRDAIKKAIANQSAPDLEDKAAEKETCAVTVRRRDEWLSHPQGKVLRQTPLVEIEKIADGPRVGFPELSKLDPPTGIRPLSGIRVLDLTHVIAGPACAKCLAEQGATVLHIYGPKRPQLPPFDIDGGHGKLSAFLDLKEDAEAKETLWELVKTADVFSESYRPGAISDLGFRPAELARAKPGIIVVSTSCYGFTGPWAHRRGFEHLAQAATGIATALGSDEAPKITEDFYPNDYITGFLAAFGTLAALIRRAREGGSYHVRVSLCRTAMKLLDLGLDPEAPAKTNVPAPTLARYMLERDSALGRLHYLGPVLRYSETPSDWDLPPAPLGAHPPRWPDWV